MLRTAPGQAPMARRDAAPETELVRLKAEQERLRQRQIVVLREELTKAMERVEALRRELRLLGDHEVASFWGKTNWHQIFERLPPTFTAKDSSIRARRRIGCKAWAGRNRHSGVVPTRRSLPRSPPVDS